MLFRSIMGIVRFKKRDIDDEVFSRKEFTNKWKEVEILEAKLPKDEKMMTFVPDREIQPFKSPFDDIEKDREVKEENVVLPEMRYQGIIWKSSRPQAIINNKVYDIKDIINVETSGEGIMVKDIDKEGIHLLYKGKEFIVRPK